MPPAAVLHYFRTVADHSPLPVLLYNIPQCVHYEIPVELVAESRITPTSSALRSRAATWSGFRAVVAATQVASRRTVMVTPIFEAVTTRMLAAKTESAGTFVSAGDLSGGVALATAPPAVPLKTRTKDVGFQVLCGSATTVSAALEAGATGAILAFVCGAPQACQEVYLAWKDHDTRLAAEKQERIAGPGQRIGSGRSRNFRKESGRDRKWACGGPRDYPGASYPMAGRPIPGKGRCE